MTLHIGWDAVSAICAVLGVMTTLLVFSIRSIVREELGKLREAFVSKEVFDEHTKDSGRRLDRLERRHAS